MARHYSAAGAERRDASLLHRGEVVPEVAQTVGATEERGEVCGIDQHDVAGALSVRRHPDQRVEFGVARSSERMRADRISRMAVRSSRERAANSLL